MPGTYISRDPYWRNQADRILHHQGGTAVTQSERESVVLKAGSLYGTVPEVETGTFAARFLEAVLQSKPTWMDAAVVTCAYGRPLPISTRARDKWYEDFVNNNGDARRNVGFTRLLLAYDEALTEVEAARIDAVTRLSRGVLAVQTAAIQRLQFHLFQTERLAEETKARFPAIHGSSILDYTAPLDMAGLRKFMVETRELTSLRRAADLDRLSGKHVLLQAVALGLALTPLARLSKAAGAAHGIANLGFTVEEGWRAAFESLGIVGPDQAKVRATTQFLQNWMELARDQPVLLVIDLDKLGLFNPSDVKATESGVVDLVYEALDRVADSIKALRAANRPQPGLVTTPTTSTTVADVLTTLKATGDLGVWRLPYFIPAALDEVPPRVKAEVSALLDEYAEGVRREALAAQVASEAMQTVVAVASLSKNPYLAGVALLCTIGDLWLRHSRSEPARVLYNASLSVDHLLRSHDVTGNESDDLGGIAGAAVQAVLFHRMLVAGRR
jgi:hypothetical protein